jgi:peptidylprolyl isomerase/peptidyl-prolyl cis-trans isomerase B (cyclophilin B)
MGKIQKIKEERKKARVEAEITRKKRNRFLLQLLAISFLLLAVLGAGSVGYKVADSKYGLSEKIKEKGEQVMNIFKKEPEANSEEPAAERKTYSSVPAMQIDVSKEYVANFETNKGNFKIKLFASDAPKTVNNFVVLSRDGFYNGLTFHRIISDFMIQGGDPSGDGTGGPGYQFEDEINDHKLVRGTLAMANSGEDTNGSQFFIVTKEATDWLDGKHTAFGEVIEGMDIVAEIEKVEVGENDKPISPITINKIEIVEK